MMTRDQIRQALIRDEDVVQSAYQDSLGYWTIAVGRLIDARKGGRLSLPECYYLLDNDLDRSIAGCTAAFPWFARLDPVRQGVLVQMVFQMGVDGVQAFTQTLGAIRRGDYQAAALGMLASKWATKDSPGRAARLAAQMERGAL